MTPAEAATGNARGAHDAGPAGLEPEAVTDAIAMPAADRPEGIASTGTGPPGDVPNDG